jgi:tetraacyldisaccharide 4'-kinase
VEHPFPDHHAFTPHDLKFGDDLPVLMTAKDAVKCSAFARANIWQVPVRAELPQEFFDRIAAQLIG